jgi:hypothetical protein
VGARLYAPTKEEAMRVWSDVRKAYEVLRSEHFSVWLVAFFVSTALGAVGVFLLTIGMWLLALVWLVAQVVAIWHVVSSLADEHCAVEGLRREYHHGVTRHS